MSDQQEFEKTLSSGKIIALRAISGREQMNADSVAGGNPSKSIYYRCMMAITRIGETKYAPATSDLELNARLDALTGRECDEIAMFYAENFMPEGADVKKESSTQSFASSQPSSEQAG